MSAALYFCVSCGEPQPELGQFCTSCGERIEAGALQVTAARPGSTVRLSEDRGISKSAPATAPNSLPPTTAIPAFPARSSRRARFSFGRISPWWLAIGAGALVALLAVGLAVWRGLPFGGDPGVDRVIVLAQSHNGDTNLVLMRSDGSGKITLVDQPGETGSSSSSQYQAQFYVSYNQSERGAGQIRSFGDRGAAVLREQQRILFWYPSRDGMEIRSANLDGGDVTTIAQASAATHMAIPERGDNVLLLEREKNESRLSLVDLRGKATPLIVSADEAFGIISPDGKHVAYWQRDTRGRYALTVADDIGGNTVEVAHDLHGVSANYSDDGSRLFIVRADEKGASLVVTNADGQNPIVLSRSARSGRGTVSNGRLIYEVEDAGERSLFTSDPNGDDRVEIARGAEALSWDLTPDRQQIVFVQKRNGRYLLQISDVKHEQVQDLKRNDGIITWRALDNGRLLVMRYSSNSNTTTLSTINPDGTDEQVLKRDLYLTSIDLSGDDILVGGEEDGYGVLYLLGGKEPVTLDDEANGYMQARIAPDGRIIYTAEFKSGPVSYVVDRNGKQRKLLAEDAAIVATGF